jgi:hypothetical protein
MFPFRSDAAWQETAIDQESNGNSNIIKLLLCIFILSCKSASLHK